jgi:Mn-dependent DtxR family transcriptional regulator
MPDNVLPFEVPAKPRIKQQDALPDQRKIVVMPFKAIFDERLNHGTLRTLSAIAAFSNRAGITWVSQVRISKDLKISQQAVSKQVTQLKALGYIEVVKKGFHGKSTDTIRIIFDEEITAAEAIAMVSNKEDARPPGQIEAEAKRLQNDVDLEGLKRIQDMIKQSLTTTTKQPPKEYQMPNDRETITVKKMKAEIKKNTQRPVDNSAKKAHVDNPQVVHGEAHIDNLQVVNVDNLQVVENTVFNTISIKLNVINNKQLKQYSKASVESKFDLLVSACQAEGLNPPEHVMVDGIINMFEVEASMKAV